MKAKIDPKREFHEPAIPAYEKAAPPPQGLRHKLLELGPDEYFESDGLTFVEWADRVADLLPRERLEVTLEVTGETSRGVTLGGG